MNKRGTDWENFAIEQLSMIILTNSKEREIDNKVKQTIRENLSPKFCELIEKYFNRIRDLEYKNNHLWQTIINNVS